MLAMLGLANANSAYQFISVEIKQTAFRIDGIFKPIDTDQNLPIIFVEVQFQPDPDFYGRLYSEIMLYLYQHKPNRSWLAVVIYPTRNLERSPNIEHLCLVN